MLQRIWNNLINLGTSNNSRDHDNKKIRVANIVLIISAFALNLFSLLNWYLGFIELIALDFFISLVVIFCVYLNSIKRFTLSHIIMFGLVPAIFFIYPYFVGNIGAEYYYFFLLVVGFYILDKRSVIYAYAIYIFILFLGSKYAIHVNTFDDKYLILETVHYYPSIIASVIMVLIATWVFKNDTLLYQHAIVEQNTELAQVKDQIDKQNKLLEQRNTELARMHMDLTSSLSYASQIQKSILLPETVISAYFKSLIILYKPKAIVSGDFYWFKDLGNRQLFAVVDCTGHGVPGAFMTAMANTMLNEIVDNSKITDVSKILLEVKHKLEKTLNLCLPEDRVHDGMDIALCSIDSENGSIEFAGARRSLYLFRNNELIEYKSTKSTIDGTRLKKIEFDKINLKVQTGDRFYMFTDGYPDQFGGTAKTKQKFLIKRFLKLLVTIQSHSLAKQKSILLEKLQAWQQNEEQTDDILFIGFEV